MILLFPDVVCCGSRSLRTICNRQPSADVANPVCLRYVAALSMMHPICWVVLEVLYLGYLGFSQEFTASLFAMIEA